MQRPLILKHKDEEKSEKSKKRNIGEENSPGTSTIRELNKRRKLNNLMEEKSEKSKKRNIGEENSPGTSTIRELNKRRKLNNLISKLVGNDIDVERKKGKGILKTSERPVICKHEYEEKSKSKKKRNIGEENSSGTSTIIESNKRRKLHNLICKLVQNPPRKRKNVGILKKNKKKCKFELRRNDLDQHSTIQIGDTLNLSDLLFTNTRNYLINYNQNKLVRGKDLAGRVIVLQFMSLRYSESAVITHLLDIYSKLQPGGGFEIVFVAISDDGEYISSDDSKRQLSQMPWPAIPLYDFKSRECLERIFVLSSAKETYMPPSFIIDPGGVVLQCHSTPLFIRYGAAGYPFTNERIEFLDSEDKVFQMQPVSIQKLLASPQRDYLLDNDGDQVPLHYLDDKVVGLYFCPYLHQSYPTEEFEMVYEELLETREDFEIVLVYTPGWYEYCHGRTGEGMFMKKFKSMPWLALPFDDTDCNKKLQRIFKYPQELGGRQPNPMLVIIGPHGKFIEPLGGQILLNYGAPAYPFTTSSTVKLELERVKKLKPEMLWDLDSLFTHNDGSQVLFSQLVGKRIIVIFQDPDIPYKFTIKKLIERYLKMKGTDDEFEVIHILCDWCLKNFAAPVPWLMHPPFNSHSYADELVESIFRRHYGLLAFDRDGSVVRRTKVLEFGESMIFPFYQNEDMDKEVLLEVEKYITFRIRGDDDGILTVYD